MIFFAEIWITRHKKLKKLNKWFDLKFIDNLIKKPIGSNKIKVTLIKTSKLNKKSFLHIQIIKVHPTFLLLVTRNVEDLHLWQPASHTQLYFYILH